VLTLDGRYRKLFALQISEEQLNDLRQDTTLLPHDDDHLIAPWSIALELPHTLPSTDLGSRRMTPALSTPDLATHLSASSSHGTGRSTPPARVFRHASPGKRQRADDEQAPCPTSTTPRPSADHEADQSSPDSHSISIALSSISLTTATQAALDILLQSALRDETGRTSVDILDWAHTFAVRTAKKEISLPTEDDFDRFFRFEQTTPSDDAKKEERAPLFNVPDFQLAEDKMDLGNAEDHDDI
jgi:hypothetical protein